MQKVVNIKQKEDPLKYFDQNTILFSFDNDFKMMSCNKAFEQVTGFKESKIKDNHVFLDLFNRLPIYTVDDIQYTIKQGKIWEGNLKLPHPTKKYAWYNVHIMPTHNNLGEKIGYTTICAPGKSQADMITASSSTETWMKAIFNDPEEANILINMDGGIIEFNKAAFNFAEWYAQKELSLDSSIFDYFNTKFIKTLKALMSKTKKGRRQKFCRSFNNIAGYNKTFDIELRPVFSSDMSIMGCIMVIVDITAKVELSKRIKKSEKRLSDIAFINAHEVRAPLASILGLLHLLDFEDVDDNSKQIVNRLKQSASDLEKIIHKVSESTYIDGYDNPSKSA